MDFDSVRRFLETFNLATTNAIQMKFATILYVEKVFPLAEN